MTRRAKEGLKGVGRERERIMRLGQEERGREKRNEQGNGEGFLEETREETSFRLA